MEKYHDIEKESPVVLNCGQFSGEPIPTPVKRCAQESVPVRLSSFYNKAERIWAEGGRRRGGASQKLIYAASGITGKVTRTGSCAARQRGRSSTGRAGP